MELIKTKNGQSNRVAEGNPPVNACLMFCVKIREWQTSKRVKRRGKQLNFPSCIFVLMFNRHDRRDFRKVNSWATLK